MQPCCHLYSEENMATMNTVAPAFMQQLTADLITLNVKQKQSEGTRMLWHICICMP